MRALGTIVVALLVALVGLGVIRMRAGSLPDERVDGPDPWETGLEVGEECPPFPAYGSNGSAMAIGGNDTGVYGLVFLSATCRYCTALGKTIRRLDDSALRMVVVVQSGREKVLDVIGARAAVVTDSNGVGAALYGVLDVPTVYMVRDGVVIARAKGLHECEVLLGEYAESSCAGCG